MVARPRTPDGIEALDALIAEPETALVAFDYDGTLSPIVSDPAAASVHPDAVDALVVLAAYVGKVAVVTGRPPASAVELGGFDRPGLEGLTIAGHYGAQRWEGRTKELSEVEAPRSLEEVRERLPKILAVLELESAEIEDKEIAIAVHVRNSADPAKAQRHLLPPLSALAQRWDLGVEPGRYVIELRPRGFDKGKALRTLVAEQASQVVVMVGDDLGDLAAFDEVEVMRSEGLFGLLVCSGSEEVAALAERADLVVDGPQGVVDFIRDVTDAIEAARGS